MALARRGFIEIAQRTAFDIHPPLYYWLLKIWITMIGDSEIGLRSLSVVLAIWLVYIIFLLGRRLFSARVGLIAAVIATFSPLQIYYAQEARMYMLLTVLGSLTILAMLRLLDHISPPLAEGALEGLEYSISTTSRSGLDDLSPLNPPVGGTLKKLAPKSPAGESFIVLPPLGGGRGGRIFQKLGTNLTPLPLHLSSILTPLSLIYILTVTAGLYTHYAFPLILLITNAFVLLWRWRYQRAQFRLTPQLEEGQPSSPGLQAWWIRWSILHLIPLLFYLPWLPIAWRQVTTWPSERQIGTWGEALTEISTTLLFGLSWPFGWGLLMVGGIGMGLVVTGWLGRKANLEIPPLALSLLWLWLLLPILLTALIFSPAFLKFLLIATPPLALLLAVLIAWLTSGRPRPLPEAGSASFGATWPGYLSGVLLFLLVISSSSLSLFFYYTASSFARDNYRGIVTFITAVSTPTDAVILNAEGQQDVFNYYYEKMDGPKAAVYPLPRQRPLDEGKTLTELQRITTQSRKLYAVYWAAQQADPNRIIEGWLDTKLFKATDQWYGNVRLVSYASPQPEREVKLSPIEVQLGDSIKLTGYSLASAGSTAEVAPGDILQVTLQWETDAPLPEDYTIFIQVLDQANHLVGQRDAPPTRPSSTWPVAEPFLDTHGIFIEPGTPPGLHRVILGLYDSETGQRLPVTTSPNDTGKSGPDFIELDSITVTHPALPLPQEAFTIQTELITAMAEVTLVGYDLYKLGHRSSPDTPLRSGDPLQLTLYWQAGGPLQQLEDQLLVRVVTPQGENTSLSTTYPLAGTHYPPDQWQPGEIIRAQYHLFLTNLERGRYRLALTLTDKAGTEWVETLSSTFEVE